MKIKKGLLSIIINKIPCIFLFGSLALLSQLTVAQELQKNPTPKVSEIVGSKDGNITTFHQKDPLAFHNHNKLSLAQNETFSHTKSFDGTGYFLHRVKSGVADVQGSITTGHDNHHIWISSPNGVVLGENARLNVGSFLATTGDISTDKFQKVGLEKIELDNIGPGYIEVKKGAEAVIKGEGGYFALLGTKVDNAGKITFNHYDSKYVLASGKSLAFDVDGDSLIYLMATGKGEGITDTGTVKNNGGEYHYVAPGSLINVTADIEANSIIPSGKEGEVHIARIFVDGGAGSEFKPKSLKAHRAKLKIDVPEVKLGNIGAKDNLSDLTVNGTVTPEGDVKVRDFKLTGKWEGIANSEEALHKFDVLGDFNIEGSEFNRGVQAEGQDVTQIVDIYGLKGMNKDKKYSVGSIDASPTLYWTGGFGRAPELDNPVTGDNAVVYQLISSQNPSIKGLPLTSSGKLLNDDREVYHSFSIGEGNAVDTSKMTQAQVEALNQLVSTANSNAGERKTARERLNAEIEAQNAQNKKHEAEFTSKKTQVEGIQNDIEGLKKEIDDYNKKSDEYKSKVGTYSTKKAKLEEMDSKLAGIETEIG